MTIEVTNEVANGSNLLDVSKMLAKCEELVCQFEYELALKFCDKILLAAPQNIEAFMMKATILIDMNKENEAKQVYF